MNVAYDCFKLCAIESQSFAADRLLFATRTHQELNENRDKFIKYYNYINY